MDSISVERQEPPVCERCKEYAEDQGSYEILITALAFIGPIVGILIGLFAGKKLLGKQQGK